MGVRGFALLVFLLSSAAWADVDVKAAMPVLLKVLTYDTNFDSRGAGDFVVLVVSDGSGTSARAQLLTDLKDVSVTKVKNRPVKYVSVEYKDEAGLQADIDRTKASALMAIPGTPAAAIKSMWEVAQDNQMYALALEASMVEQYFPVGVSMGGDKPQIVINEKSSRAVGVRFETSVLRLARVIQ
jgi:YfiR/HmsC-like